MARAWKCDVCGNYYDHYGVKDGLDSYRGGNNTNSIRMIYTTPDRENSFLVKHYDCCPKCLDEITRVINNLKIGAE